MKKPEADLARAQYEAIQAKNRIISTAGALQYRLKPATIANQAWEGMRDRSTELADDALQAVKERPGAASGVVAAIVVFLARHPLWRVATRIVSRRSEDEGVVTTRLDTQDENYDLTAPKVDRSAYEGVSA